MKKLYCIFSCGLLLVCVLLVSGCNKNNKVSIVGKWANGSYIYTFNDDKTCSYDAAGTLMECTYEIEGDKISILYKGNTSSFETTYYIEGDTLHIKDSFGSDVKYEKK